MRNEQIDYKALFEQEQQKKREAALEDFNFEIDLQAYVDKAFPVDKHEMLTTVHDKYATALETRNIESLTRLQSHIKNRINYLGEKYKDSEEDMKYLLKLKLIEEELIKIISALETKE